jgi:hypothetical protein
MSTLDRGNLDTYLVDKSSVLCALNIRQIQMKRAGLLSRQSLCGKHRAHQDIAGNKLMCQNRIYTLTALSNSCLMFFTNYFTQFFVLAIDSNVQYVEQGIMLDFS